MKIVKPTSDIEKYYKILFSLPNTIYLIVFLTLIISLLIMFYKVNSIPYIVYLVTLISVLTIYSRISRTVLYRFRRILTLSIVIMLYTMVIGYLTTWFIAILSSLTILTVTIAGLEGTKLTSYLLALIPYYIYTITMYYIGFLDYEKALISIPLSLLIVVADYLLYRLLSRYRVNGFSALDLGTMFIRNWLERWDDLDKAFNHLGIVYEVRPRIIYNDKVALIYTDIHYGPFSNIGSSMFPDFLEKRFREENIYPIVFHGMGSHDRDLSSRRYVDSFITYLLELMNNGSRQDYYGAFKVRGGDNWEVLTIVFSDLSLVIIARPGKGIDDLPYDLQKIYEKKVEDKGLGDIILIDAHNWEKIQDFNLSELEQVLDRVIDRIKEYRERKPSSIYVKVGYTRTEALGVINGSIYGLKIFSEENEREKIFLLFLRGNNMAPGVRDKIISIIKKFLGENIYVEVLTNDEHTETGIYSRTTYIPVQDTEELYQDIVKLLHIIESSHPIKGFKYVYGKTRYPLLNDNAEKLINLLRKTYPLSILLYSSYILFSPIILYFLQWFIQNILFK